MANHRVPPARRHLADAALAILTLAVAVLNGYALLAADRLRATPEPKLATPAPAPKPPAPVVAQPEPWPEPLEGSVVDAERGRPIPGASLSVGSYEVRTDSDGRFTIGPLSPDARVLVKAPGFEPKQVSLGPGWWTTVALVPHVVKAAYLSYFGVGDSAIRERVFQLADRTELNAVVIDVKGDRGFIPYPTQVSLAVEAGAVGPVRLQAFEEILAALKAKGIYTIARVVAFKDNVLARHRPEWAVLDARTGKPWLDTERLAWLDPFREEAWSYVLEVAREAALKGFDEIQFDYVRFPTDGKLSARYARPNTKETRLRAVSAFLARARRELAPLGVFVAADIFGYAAFNENDTEIGQRVEDLAPYVDYLSPMAYPSGYHRGIPGYRNPVEHPYEIVHQTVRLVRLRAAHTGIKVRPWIQDFRDYAFDRRPFGVKEIHAQMKAAADAGAVGWMLWNSRNEYTAAALRPKVAVTSGRRSAR